MDGEGRAAFHTFLSRKQAQLETNWLQRVGEDPLALFHAPDPVKADRAVVLAAARKCGFVLQAAAETLRADREIVLAAVENEGKALEFASLALRGDREVVEKAVMSDPSAIKHVSEPLKPNDPELLRLAGMLRVVGSPESLTAASAEPCLAPRRRPVVMSVKYGFTPKASDTSSSMYLALEQNPGLHLYNPNVVSKGFCGWSKRRITDMSWPCRGDCRRTFLGNCHGPCLPSGNAAPTDRSCWRYSFRWHLQDAKSKGGFMLQIVERSENGGLDGQYEFGKGQEIETKMAEIVRIKTFRVYVKTNLHVNMQALKVCARIEAWLKSGGDHPWLDEIDDTYDKTSSLRVLPRIDLNALGGGCGQ